MIESKLTFLTNLIFVESALNSIPDEMFEERDKIEQYFRDFSQGTAEWREMKLVVLGHGRIGKTTLVHAIQKKTDLTPKEGRDEIQSTVGVDVIKSNLSKKGVVTVSLILLVKFE